MLVTSIPPLIKIYELLGQRRDLLHIYHLQPKTAFQQGRSKCTRLPPQGHGGGRPSSGDNFQEAGTAGVGAGGASTLRGAWFCFFKDIRTQLCWEKGTEAAAERLEDKTPACCLQAVSVAWTWTEHKGLPAVGCTGQASGSMPTLRGNPSRQVRTGAQPAEGS